MRKVIDGAAHQAVPILFFDNLKGYLSSGALEAFLTANTWRYRLLGSTNYTEADNVATVYLTANFATYSSDLRRRLLVVELILEEAWAEERIIKNYLDEGKLVAMRSKLLSIFWAMVKDWDQKGQPASQKLLPTFEAWSEIISGVVENAGFVSPCQMANLKTGGDTYTRDMGTLVSEMVPGTEYKFSDLIGLAYDHHLFPFLISETGSLTPSDRSRLGKIFRRFVDRIFQQRYRFCLSGFSRNTERFFCPGSLFRPVTKTSRSIRFSRFSTPLLFLHLLSLLSFLRAKNFQRRVRNLLNPKNLLVRVSIWHTSVTPNSPLDNRTMLAETDSLTLYLRSAIPRVPYAEG